MMEEYWYGIKIADIKEIHPTGGQWNKDTNITRTYFTLVMNNGERNIINFFVNGYNYKEGHTFYREIKRLYNEANNVPEIYILYTEVFARINGQCIHVGYEVKNILDDYQIFTCQEITELNRQFKIKDDGVRSLVYIQVFEIEGSKVKTPIEKRWIDQLNNMGYDITKLDYELKCNFRRLK